MTMQLGFGGLLWGTTLFGMSMTFEAGKKDIFVV